MDLKSAEKQPLAICSDERKQPWRPKNNHWCDILLSDSPIHNLSGCYLPDTSIPNRPLLDITQASSVRASAFGLL